MWEPKFFCCCTVRQGSFLIGSLILVWCVTDIGLSLIGIPRNLFVPRNGEGCREGDQRCKTIATRNQVKSTVFLSIRLLTNVLLLSVTSMLIHGLRKGRPRLMVPYLVVHVIAIVSLFLSTIIQLVTLARANNLPNFFMLMLIGPVAVAILIYMYLAVRSAYLETKRSKIQNYAEFQDEDGISTA